MTSELISKIKDLKGPVVVIGASGFLGANLFRACLGVRDDVIGTTFSGESWRLHGIPAQNIAHLNLLDPISVNSFLQKFDPATIFDCSSFGAYSFEKDWELIHSTNYASFIRFLETLRSRNIAAYIHAGSSSEYGSNSRSPRETDPLLPNSHYAVSKAAAAMAVAFYGKTYSLPVVNLRLYSIYGPYEDASRLIPVLCEKSLGCILPPFARQEVSRDFIHVDDVVESFIDAACMMRPDICGESFNIGTGTKTSLQTLACLTKKLFNIDSEPIFDSSVGRAWDVDEWVANPEKASLLLGWRAKIKLEQGLVTTQYWWGDYLKNNDFSRLTKKTQQLKVKNSISAIVACYKDAQAIPFMYERLVKTFRELQVDYEIIFVNDNSPDDSSETIRGISSEDPHVIGITHSRNFGSQAAFRSGMELASKEACVLLDGDLQDPPELIKDFVSKWKTGADVVFGRRVRRDMSFVLECCYKTFYRIFTAISEFPIPNDAGDFSLIDQKVVHWLLQCKERDAFLRGLRAYVGFNQESVDYIRPERMFGQSTNNWFKNIGWAKKAIFSFSRTPLHLLTALGGVFSILSIILALVSIVIRFTNPSQTPPGITFLALLQMFFGSFIILGIGLLGEYVGKILEETKARPSFIRKNIISRGEIKTI
jgi:nucleoside-diphosphate-sugar epimerase/glycosyltransferase involved in cell wall biosynthesis